MKIKNESLIAQSFKDNGENFYILKNDTKLSDVFDFLPAGIINKNVTGIGATTLEIECQRNSIIVEPLKAIAYSKAKKHLNCLYVGGDVRGRKATSDNEIKKFHNSKLPDKTFLVVADSLPRLIAALGQAEAFKYFLMIDEVDSFQLDTNFRNKLENCLDYYKLFPKNKRSLVSSTMIDFSDPELLDEPRFSFNYQMNPSRTINVNYSENVKGAAIDFIYNLALDKPKEKILVAYNSVDGCLACAKYLVEVLGIDENAVKILCSQKRKGDVGSFYSELHNGILEGRINFITSAYFVGVDINETYHSIAISNPELQYTLLSLGRLKQIAGRCRRSSLLSESIYYNVTHFLAEGQVPIDVLLNTARAKTEALECILRNYKNDQILAGEMIAVRNLVVGKSDILGYNLVRTTITGELRCSYFNVDACLDTMHTTKVLYSNLEDLPNRLTAEGHLITSDVVDSSTAVLTLARDQISKIKDINFAIEALRNLNLPSDISRLLPESNSKFQTQLYTRFKELYRFVDDKETLLHNLYVLSQKNVKAYDNYVQKVSFICDETPFKKAIIESFPIGSVYNSTQILAQLNKANALSGLQFLESSNTKAVQILGNFIQLKKNKRKLIDDNPSFTIVGFYTDVNFKLPNVSPAKTKLFEDDDRLEKEPNVMAKLD